MTSRSPQAFLTGGTGFIGARLAARLRREGRAVRALVRTPAKAARLRELGCELVAGDLTEPASFRDAVRGCDEVFHLAAWYELGVPAAQAQRIHRVNVDGTEAVLDAAARAGARRIVHCSSVAALGPTGGRLVDETHTNDGHYRSLYERTKAEAHELAMARARAGAPIVVGMPGTVYGPADPSLVGLFHRELVRGLVVVGGFDAMSMTLVHVEDAADGLFRCATRAQAGQSYVLGADVVTMKEWIATACDLTGIRRPLFSAPAGLVKAAAPWLAPLARLAGLPPELVSEGVEMSAGLTWAFSGDKARRDLEWRPRTFDAGLAETLAWYRDRYAPKRRFHPRTERARAALAAAGITR
ncbi:MAG: NAD-dependent epimerase/dehydratase family protein [bacterium]